jgi:hypothetical protein
VGKGAEMMQAKITEMHQDDAYHYRKQEIIGQIVDVSKMREWKESDAGNQSLNGYWYGEADDYHFHGIKFEFVIDTIQLLQSRIDILTTRLAAIHGAAIKANDAWYYGFLLNMSERLNFILAESAPNEPDKQP